VTLVWSCWVGGCCLLSHSGCHINCCLVYGRSSPDRKTYTFLFLLGVTHISKWWVLWLAAAASAAAGLVPHIMYMCVLDSNYPPRRCSIIHTTSLRMFFSVLLSDDYYLTDFGVAVDCSQMLYFLKYSVATNYSFPSVSYYSVLVTRRGAVVY
jgi:hypothetical protein